MDVAAMFRRKNDQNATDASPPNVNLLPQTLRSKLVSTYGGAEQQGGLLKRSSTDDLVRPGQILGKGTFGVVKLRHHKNTGEPFAVKTMDKPGHWDRGRLVREALVLQNLDHPHIQRIFGWHDDAKTITMVIEYCAGGELLDAVNNARRDGEAFRENWAAITCKQLFEAVAYLHARGLVHMDIKSGNILLLHDVGSTSLFKTKPHIVVADLGLAIVLDPSTSWFKKKLAGDAKGTPATMAPEVWRGDIGPKNDVWSVGCILYELFCHRLPYLPDDPHDQSQKTWEKLYKQAEANMKQELEVRDCSAEVKRLCTQLLSVDPKTRPVVKDMLTNPWFERFLASGSMSESLHAIDMQLLTKAIKKWPKMKPIHQAVCVKLASDARGTAKFASIFTQIDTDGDGVLSRHELQLGLQQLGVPEQDAADVAQALDYNNDGTCEYLEFTAACLSSLGTEFDELLRQEWASYDTFGDGNGRLEGSNFKRLVYKLKPICAQRSLSVEQFVEQFSGKSDGTISFSDFASKLGGGCEQDIQKPKENPVAEPSSSTQPAAPKTNREEEVIQYYSKSHGRWLDTTLLEHGANGAVQLAIKPGYWISIEEQKECLRNCDGKPYKPIPKAVTRRTKSDTATAPSPVRTAPAATLVSGTPTAKPKADAKFKGKGGSSVDSHTGKSKPKAGASARTRQTSRDSAQPEGKPMRIKTQTELSSRVDAPPETDLPFVPSSGLAFEHIPFPRWGAFNCRPQEIQRKDSLLHFRLDRVPPPPEQPRPRDPNAHERQLSTTTVAQSPTNTDREESNGELVAKSKAKKKPRETTASPAASPPTSPKRKASTRTKSDAGPQKPGGSSTKSAASSSCSSDPPSPVGVVEATSQMVSPRLKSNASSGAQKSEASPPSVPRDITYRRVRNSKFDADKNDAALEAALNAVKEFRPKNKPAAATATKSQSLLSFTLTHISTKKTANKLDPAGEWKEFSSKYIIPGAEIRDGRPIIIIDWDDTIVPTTFIHREIMGGNPLHTLVEVHRQSKHFEDFVFYTHLVEAVLRAAKQVAHVAILTLASRWWVDASLDKYFFGVDMRAVIEELDIEVFHAELDAENVMAVADGSDRRSAAKRTAFSSCLKAFYGTDTVLWNVMSVGDAMVEHDALKAVLQLEGGSENSKHSGQPLCKTVKFIADPTLEDLCRQLEAFLETVAPMTHSNKSFHRVLV